MKTHFELKIMLMSGLFLETQVNVVVVVTIIAKGAPRPMPMMINE